MEKLRPLIAEFIGTFTLIFIGAGSICLDTVTGGKVGLLGIAVAHGLAIALMITNFGHISGGHFNPAVTFGFFVTKRFDAWKTFTYWAAQLFGAVIGAVLLAGIFKAQAFSTHVGLPMFGDNIAAAGNVAFIIGPKRAMMIEMILTFFLVLAVFATAVDERGAFKMVAGFGIGLTVTLDILMGGPLTGASMNPARSFGPALVSGYFTNHWLYWVGPLMGGGFAAALYDVLFLKGQKKA
jgi:MIP family channel proteins